MDQNTMNALLTVGGLVVGWLVRHFMGGTLGGSASPSTPATPANPATPATPNTPAAPSPDKSSDPLSGLPGFPGHPLLNSLFPLLSKILGSAIGVKTVTSFGAVATKPEDVAPIDAMGIAALAHGFKQHPAELALLKKGLE